MNINNQPSFGASFKWDAPIMAREVSSRMNERSFNAICDAIPDLKKIGGDEFTHVIVSENDRFRPGSEADLVNGPACYFLKTILEQKDGGPLEILRRPFVSIKNAQENVKALQAAERYGFSQEQVDSFTHPSRLIDYCKASDIEE